MSKWFFPLEESQEDKFSCSVKKLHDLPPTLEQQYDNIYNVIVQTKLTIYEIASIIALYSLSIGYKTDFRSDYFTYSCYTNKYPTVVSYDKGARDFQNALLDFSFRGRCKVRFRIHEKGDEMWLGVVGNPNYLDEDTFSGLGEKGQWAFYCGRTRERYRDTANKKSVSRAHMLRRFKRDLNCQGVRTGGFGSFHFPDRFLHRLVPCNTGDVVDLEVDAEEKTFAVIVNDVFQVRSKALGMPKQLAFFVQLDYTGDRVEFEILDFKFAKRRKRQDLKGG